MKKRIGVLLFLLFFSQTSFSQQSEGFAENFMSGFEAGLRARYYREQLRLMELQRKALEADLKKAEAETQQEETKPSAADEIRLELRLFEAKHPDWRKYEKEMVHFGKRLMPNNISTQEYLEILYILAKAHGPLTVFDDIKTIRDYPLETEPRD